MRATSQLNIKNPEARQIATELSKLTGQSVTQVVTSALREKLARETRKKSKEGIAEELMEIARRSATLPVLDPRDPDDILYDEFGLLK